MNNDVKYIYEFCCDENECYLSKYKKGDLLYINGAKYKIERCRKQGNQYDIKMIREDTNE